MRALLQKVFSNAMNDKVFWGLVVVVSIALLAFAWGEMWPALLQGIVAWGLLAIVVRALLPRKDY